MNTEMTLQGGFTGSAVTSTKKTCRKRLGRIVSIIAVIVLAFYFGAEPFLKWLYGIHDPRVETKTAIVQAARKYQLPESSICCIAPDSYKTMMHAFGGLPEGMVFDKRGNFIQYKATSKSCNAGLFGFLEALDGNKHYPAQGGKTLYEQVAQLRTLDGHLLPAAFIDTTADFTVLLLWASFVGKLNEDHIRVWRDIALANKKARIQVIAVNADGQEWWPLKAKTSLVYRRYHRNNQRVTGYI